ncbi:phage portal protein [Streptococcus equi]|uniref:Phage portal protein n=1 Tax=Streptococcus equi subsp. ruminatorum TaxID=254358 RepID=A0A6M1KSN0_9STRE|nr:phage portal protein [Streptococcus equi]NGL84146.1 phage portal protein [Streptococcus equi subsp. ruminatorum]
MLDTNNIELLGKKIKSLIDSDRASNLKSKMRQGINYYDSKHDILDYRLFYFDSNDKLKEEKYRANTKISHGFFTELVDQKVQYLLSNPIEIKTQQEGLQDYLNEYVNEDFQLILQELVEGASQKACEYVFWKLDSTNRLIFKTADALKTIPIYDDNLNISQMIYYYEDEIAVDGKNKKVIKAQLWTAEQVFYFVSKENNDFVLDDSLEINPSYHKMVRSNTTGELFGKGYGQVPFIKLSNNKREKTDLEPIKGLIDDYDLMACSLSNNLIDFDHPIYAVRGFQGDNLDKLTQNLKTRKTVGVATDGGIDVQTVNIPVEARKTKLSIDKEGIYKFGMGFDSSQSGDGNITNVVIKSRYSLLDLKCNKTEIRLRAVIKQMLELIVQNINELHNKAYDTSDIEIIITRDVMANETDNVTIDKIEAETKQILINNIMTAATRLDDRTVLELLADVLQVDADDVEKKLDEQNYHADFNRQTEVIDVGVEQISEGDRDTPVESRQKH